MKKHITHAFLSLAIVAMVGCSNPADKVDAAKVNEAKPSAPDTPAPASAAKAYVISADSKVEFLASKFLPGGETPGSFQKFEGVLNVVDGKLSPAGSKIVIDVGSITTEKPKLTAHLKNEDFFDVPKFPTATFAATGVAPMPEDAAKQNLTGDLTMHGVTKSITFPATINVTDEAVMVKAEFHIDRYDWGMEYKGQADNMIRKEVVLKMDVTAKPGEAKAN
ncbi:MAG: YceI family protein [Limisphaerales bacterium]